MDSGDGRGGLLEYIKFMAAACDGGRSEAATLMLVTERREGENTKHKNAATQSKSCPTNIRDFDIGIGFCENL